MSISSNKARKLPVLSDLAVLFFVWFSANFIPHLIVFLMTGKIYYQLDPASGLSVETSLMVLNLLFPVLVLYVFRKSGEPIWNRLGWRWNGWRSIAWGACGFIVLLLLMVVIQIALGPQFNESVSWQLNTFERIWTLLLLLGLTAFGEEMMFRGYLQSKLIERFGVWIGIGVTALLFGLRHLPMDLYFGIGQQASLPEWLSRMVQLYAGAMAFGIVRYRAKTTWASWVMHEGFLGIIAGIGLLQITGIAT